MKTLLEKQEQKNKIKVAAQRLIPQLYNKEYSTAKIFSTDGRMFVRFYNNGGRILAEVYTANVFDSETMMNDSYWFEIGSYKTIENAIKAAATRLEKFNVTLAL